MREEVSRAQAGAVLFGTQGSGRVGEGPQKQDLEFRVSGLRGWGLVFSV